MLARTIEPGGLESGGQIQRGRGGGPRLGADVRGAVLVEFLVALMPLMITFFGFVQLAHLATAKLVVKHSAVVGARAAAVMSNEHGNLPDSGGGRGDIDLAVYWAMGMWYDMMNDIVVVVDDRSSCVDPYGPVTVTVLADYKCNVPFGSTLICGAGKIKRLTDTFTMPHQGARYFEWEGSCPPDKRARPF